MVTMRTITEQLRKIGCDYAVWGRSEIRELVNILMDDEQIMQAVNGYYDGGFALLCTTNYRVLIVDKKPLALTVEDLRYDMIAEVDYSSRVFTSVLHIFTPMRTLIFTSWSIAKLRKSMNYIQQRVMELRNNDYLMNQFIQTRTEAQPLTATTSEASTNTGTMHHHIWQRQSVPQMTPTVSSLPAQPIAEFDGYQPLARPMTNPYTKVPLLSRRRKYPSFY
ncbi:PH domain-containing protein [Candidatus Saccharibacteria bacterium]|nr:PH domain-containing protein [Candidatus Saccharibacteria bacterium]